jgi:hypothetical protein
MFLQNRPGSLERTYRLAHDALRPFSRWLTPGGWIESLLVRLEAAGKGAVFDCRMCGQCVLHSTGMTCPMSCPKEMRNGPCGGVRTDGCCEVDPAKPCVWLQAWERSRAMPVYGDQILRLQPPVDRRLQGTSAWVNEFCGRSRRVPPGWMD